MGLQKKRQFLFNGSGGQKWRYMVKKQLSQGIFDPQTVQNELDCLVFEILLIHELTPLL